MSSGYVQLPQDGTGKQVECDVVDGLYRQVVECHPAVFRPLPPPMDVPIFDYNRQRREDDSLLLLLL